DDRDTQQPPDGERAQAQGAPKPDQHHEDAEEYPQDAGRLWVAGKPAKPDRIFVEQLLSLAQGKAEGALECRKPGLLDLSVEQPIKDRRLVWQQSRRPVFDLDQLPVVLAILDFLV